MRLNRPLAGAATAWLVSAALVTCSSTTSTEAAPIRTYRMGFTAIPPRLTTESVLATIEAWRTHGDIAVVLPAIPWKSMLADTSAAFLVTRELKPVADLWRSRGLPLIVQLDVTNGLSRDKEVAELVAAGRSITEPVVQAKYREYVAAVDTILHPEYLALAMETNLIRVLAPPAVYAAARTMVNAGAADLVARGSTAKRFVTVQVETAWGRLPAAGSYVGIATDRADFPFIQAIGLSSYPFLGGFNEPEDVPLDYYARVGEGGPSLPMLVMEGGWSSASVAGVTSSPEKQTRWIQRQMLLADRAALVAVTQLTFTDFDESTAPPGTALSPFAHLGLVDKNLQAKPALAEWDKAFARPRQP